MNGLRLLDPCPCRRRQPAGARAAQRSARSHRALRREDLQDGARLFRLLLRQGQCCGACRSQDILAGALKVRLPLR